MSKDWKQSSWFNDQEQEAAKCFFDVGSHKVLDDGSIRFSFVVYTDMGDITIEGFRYFPETDEVKPPYYRAGKGWQPQVRLTGPMERLVLEAARSLSDKELEWELEPAAD